MIDDSLNDVQPYTIIISCTIRCENGLAPSEDVIDAMLKQLKAYHEAKYLKLVKVDEYQCWNTETMGDAMIFALYWKLS